MDQPRTHANRLTSQPNRAQMVEEKLTALQNSNRLAIHMLETETPSGHLEPTFSVHHPTIDDLIAVPAHRINESLDKNQPSLFSMSLLPTIRSGIAMQPYNVTNTNISNYGYLFDLSQHRSHPAKVIRAHNDTLSSDCHNHDRIPKRLCKALRLHKNSLPELDAFYNRFKPRDDYENNIEEDWQKALTAAIGGPSGNKLSEEQLDILGASYNFPPDPKNHIDNNVAPLNEILVAASTPHIAAIVVPLYEKVNGKPTSANYQASARLWGALAGLDHLDHGFNLPVVLYHIDGPQHGKTTFIGQDRTELKTIALTALKTILAQDIDYTFRSYIYEELLGAVRKHFSIDISNSDTAAISDEIDKKLAGLKTASSPSPQSHRTSPESGGRY